MKKVLLVNNSGYEEGLPLSDKGLDMLERLTGIRLPIPEVYMENMVRRDCPALFEVVEKLGKDAFNDYFYETDWKIVEIPDDMNWAIAYDANGDEILYDLNTAIKPKFKHVKTNIKIES